MMSLSTVVVAANAQLLRRVHLRPQDTDLEADTSSGDGKDRGNGNDRWEERV